MKTLHVFLSASLLILFSSLSLFAVEAKTEHWGEYGALYHINKNWLLMSDYQMRVRDDIQDYYWWRFEIGPGVRINNWVDVRVLYRNKSTETKPGTWQVEKNIFIDPTFKFYSKGKNTFDLRTRVHTKLANVGREYLRFRPRYTRRFNIATHKCNWYIYNEWWVQYSARGTRDRYNTNWLNTGFKWQLSKNLDLTTYFQYTSTKLAAKLPANRTWSNAPTIGTSLILNFDRIAKHF